MIFQIRSLISVFKLETGGLSNYVQNLIGYNEPIRSCTLLQHRGERDKLRHIASQHNSIPVQSPNKWGGKPKNPV